MGNLIGMKLVKYLIIQEDKNSDPVKAMMKRKFAKGNNEKQRNIS